MHFCASASFFPANIAFLYQLFNWIYVKTWYGPNGYIFFKEKFSNKTLRSKQSFLLSPLNTFGVRDLYLKSVPEENIVQHFADFFFFQKSLHRVGYSRILQQRDALKWICTKQYIWYCQIFMILHFAMIWVIWKVIISAAIWLMDLKSLLKIFNCDFCVFVTEWFVYKCKELFIQQVEPVAL